MALSQINLCENKLLKCCIEEDVVIKGRRCGTPHQLSPLILDLYKSLFKRRNNLFAIAEETPMHGLLTSLRRTIMLEDLDKSTFYKDLVETLRESMEFMLTVLSGGEKALTAVALVFSIFELNPAPFCLLDEVDAPLDDANVGRFCGLVKSMSDRVQFMFITHNKTTMELSDNLVGVTMNEPGVSRLVAVDVEEAVEMAAV